MCRSIKVLRNSEPPATPEDVRAAALQFVRKISGYHKPSRANQAAFERAVDEIAEAGGRLLAAVQAASCKTDSSHDTLVASHGAAQVRAGG